MDREISYCAVFVHQETCWERRSGVRETTSDNLRLLRKFTRHGDGMAQIPPDSKEVVAGAADIVSRRSIPHEEFQRLFGRQIPAPIR